MEAWANGQYTVAEGDGTVQLNAKALGQVQGLQHVIDYIDSIKENEYE